jgi:hypothetical protein
MLLGIKNELENELNDYDFSNPITISIMGPYGHFELFDGLSNILVETCKEVPTVEFDGVLNSNYEVDGSDRITDTVTRDKCRLARAPQSFKVGDIFGCHTKAIEANKLDFIDSASMMSYYGFSLYTVLGPAENIKITTPSDYYIFRSITEAKENQQILGF